MQGHHTERLADFVASLRYEDIPADVVRIAKNTIIDGIAACSTAPCVIAPRLQRVP